MRLWPVAALSACAGLFVAGCGASGSRSASFDAGQTVPIGDASPDTGIPIQIQPDGGASCTPKTCSDLKATCGPQSNGCGGVIDGGCGTCVLPDTCGGGSVPSQCGSACHPKTCADYAGKCGVQSDGCGGATPECNPCVAPEVCGAGGAFTCGVPAVGDAGIPGDGGTCVPRTCVANQCGPTNDGCGQKLDCGGCDAGPNGVCGVPTSFFCGYFPDAGSDAGLCQPKSCADLGLSCGFGGDGCGNVLNCWPDAGGMDAGTCPNGGICGGTTHGQCGTGLAPDASPPKCVPTNPCSGAGYNCGFTDDGCGNAISCWPDAGSPDSGAACSGLNSCGGGGAPNVCGGSPLPADGGSLCVPLSCSSQHIGCGAAGDGCGHTLNCYADAGTSCGANSICEAVDGGAVSCVSTSSTCVKTTCSAQNIFCGVAGDGCGGTLNCNPGDAGSCGDASTCQTVDAGVVSCVSHPATCTPTTCQLLGFNCGFTGDGCGNLLDCNAAGDAGCVAPEFCGGGGPNLCGFGYSVGDGGSAFVSCPSGAATSITGVAYAATDPALFNATTTPDPINGAYVWVPKDGKLPPITPGVTCTQCSNPTSALAVAVTGPDGTFTLPNVPVVGTVGKATVTVPLIVQVGRWARMIQLTNVTPCAANTVTTAAAPDAGSYPLRLPRTSSEGNLPWFAFDTGSVDALECVLLKMGVDQSMFSSPTQVISDMTSGAGGSPADGGTRVAMYTSEDTYQGSNQGGAVDPGDTAPGFGGSQLYGSLSTMDKFDAVLFPCVGAQVTANKAFTGAIKNVVDYANAGGRVFATHYSYVWLWDDWDSANNASASKPNDYGWGCGSGCTTANQTVGDWSPDTQWNTKTGTVNVATASGQAFAQWMVNVAPLVTHTPAGPVTSGTTVTFSINNPRGDLLSVQGGAQDWVDVASGGNNWIEQMTFNTPVDADAGAQCGRVVFSAFHVNNNGGDYGTAFPNECVDGNGLLTPMNAQERALEFMMFDLTSCVNSNGDAGACTPKTCNDYPAGTCGSQSNGCGGSIPCANCPTGQTCGGGGVANQCGSACVKRSCSFYGSGVCGTQSDGCGGTLSCPGCDGGLTCGGGGVLDQCGGCVKKACGDYPAGTCGQQSDGCGGLTTACNPCTLPATCGGGGTPNVCGVPDAGVCHPKSCGDYPAGTCGTQSDGCGSTIPCPGCNADAGLTCGGGGVANQCGAADATTCQPLTCTDYPSVCGPQSDGCGGLTQYCNPCTSPATCGGGGTPGVCGTGSCNPTTCQAQGLTCGPAGDGCGGSLDCGQGCPNGQTCGGGGIQGQCGGCTPLNCSSPGVGCGVNGDGCGGQMTCNCPSGQVCGGAGTPGVCGKVACQPETCSALHISCGLESDGCGSLLDCGTCQAGQSCTNGNCIGTPQ